MGMCDACLATWQAEKRKVSTTIKTRGESPALTLDLAHDRMVETNTSLLLCSGIPTGLRPGIGGCSVVLRWASLELWGSNAEGQHEAIYLRRDQVLKVEVSGGELTTSGGGVAGGGFGLEGALIGMGVASVLNALTTTKSRNPVVATLMTIEGLVAFSTESQSALSLTGLLAPVFADAIANRNSLRR